MLRLTNSLLRAPQVNVETAGLMLLTFANGLQASIDCSWSRPTFYPRWGHLKMEVIGEKGAVVMDSFAEHVMLYSRGASRNPSRSRHRAEGDLSRHSQRSSLRRGRGVTFQGARSEFTSESVSRFGNDLLA